MLIVAVLTFSLIHLAPGDPAALMAGIEAQEAEIEEIRERLGLNRPLPVQLGIWFKDLFQGDMGSSLHSKFPISTLIKQRLPATLSVGVFAQVVAIVVGVPLGVLAAWKANSWIDRSAMVFAVLAFSIPSFWLAYNLIFLFAVKLDWLPAIGYSPLSEGVFPWLRSLTLPAVSVGLIIAGLITRITRATLLEVLREDYVRTARAKGLAERRVLFRHALKNAAVPIMTVIGLGMAALITGLVVTETVFAIPGIGRLVVDSVQRRDYPVIQGVMLLVSLGYVMINLLIDLTYSFFDPRIRL
jgi:peptide/nickel transport system permease protein